MQAIPYTVFLCGPAFGDYSKPSAALRKILKDELEKESFTVVLGEDEGLEEIQNEQNADAQTNELAFLESKADAVVLIADSPGSFSELGLFSHTHSISDRKYLFILIICENYKEKQCYVSLGPLDVVKAHGTVIYADLSRQGVDRTGDVSQIITMLRKNRFKKVATGK